MKKAAVKVVNVDEYNPSSQTQEMKQIMDDFILLYGRKIVREIKDEYVLGGMIEAIDFCTDIALSRTFQKRVKRHLFGDASITTEGREFKIVPMFVGGRKIWVTVIGVLKT